MKKIYTIITTLLLAVLTANAQTVLINEDFSGLTAGTEDNPDATMLVDDMGDFINPSALNLMTAVCHIRSGEASDSIRQVDVSPSRTDGSSTLRLATCRAT